jgi:enamine deaminase RidA (YjgF/YER057c/UK114 family)
MTLLLFETLERSAPMPVHRFTNPPTMAKPPGYTQVVEATTPGRIVYIAGQLGLDLDNKIVGGPGDFRAQAEQTFINLKNALAAVGAGFEHVLKLNNYLIDMAHLPIFREVRDRYIDTAAPPASTTIAISNLARVGALLEVELVAVVPAKAPGKSAGAKTVRSKTAARSTAKARAKSKAAARKRR